MTVKSERTTDSHSRDIRGFVWPLIGRWFFRPKGCHCAGPPGRRRFTYTAVKRSDDVRCARRTRSKRPARKARRAITRDREIFTGLAVTSRGALARTRASFTAGPRPARARRVIIRNRSAFAHMFYRVAFAYSLLLLLLFFHAHTHTHARTPLCRRACVPFSLRRYSRTPKNYSVRAC